MAYYSNNTKMIEGGQIKNGLDTPVWVTASGSVGQLWHNSRGYASSALTPLSATSESGLNVTFTLISGALPNGLTLNENGTWSGTADSVSSDTTYTFSVRAKSLLTEDRQFTITVKSPVEVIYNYTGSDQTFNRPAGVQSIECWMWGAAGGGSYGEGFSDPGGPGGFASGIINVSSMSSLVVQVGQGGIYSSRSPRPYPAGGLQAVRSSYASGSGGGRSAVFNGSVSAANALLIAGGGGGGAGHGGGSSYAGQGGHGGGGGGTTSGSGWSTYQSESQNNANQSGSSGGSLGFQLQGADAGDGTPWPSGWNQSGGGGDGWYGGGAVDSKHQGAGGGSGYYHPSYCSSPVLATGSTTNGRVSNTYPPQTTHGYYSTGIGVGNAASNGGNGKVVIKY